MIHEYSFIHLLPTSEHQVADVHEHYFSPNILILSDSDFKYSFLTHKIHHCHVISVN